MKKMFRKACSMVLTAGVMLSPLAVPALAADVDLTVKAPETMPKAGETFEITVEVSQGEAGFYSADLTWAFDSAKMEPVRVINGPILSDSMNVSNPNAKDGMKLAVAAVSGVKDDGVVARFQLTAKEDLTDGDFGELQCTFRDENGAILNAEYTYSFDVGDSGSTGGDSRESGAGRDETDTGSSGGTGSNTGSSTGNTNTGSENSAGGAQGSASQGEKAPAIAFSDTNGHWAEDWINRAVEIGILKGYTDGRFGPNDNVTRAQFVTVLYRLAGSPKPEAEAPFADITGEIEEFRSAIAWAYEQGYVNGRSDTEFDPGGSVTRQEAMKILYGYAGGREPVPGMTVSIYRGYFTDNEEIASWARDGVYWAYYHEIINGTGEGVISPGGTTTRGQVAKILVNYLEQFDS